MYTHYIIKIYNPLNMTEVLWESKEDTFENILLQFQKQHKNSIITIQTLNNIRLGRNKKDKKYIQIQKVCHNNYFNEKIFTLRNLCKEYHIGQSGNKYILSTKLQKIFPYVEKTTKELKLLCQENFLKCTGNRNTLLKRLINIQKFQQIQFIKNKSHYNDIIKQQSHIIILIIAKWCKKSKLLIPKFIKLSKHFNTIKFYFINVENDSCNFIFEHFESTPSILFYKNSEIYKSIDNVSFKNILLNIDMKKTILSLFKKFSEKTKNELSQLCKQHNLLDKGLKSELIDRLIKFYQN